MNYINVENRKEAVKMVNKGRFFLVDKKDEVVLSELTEEQWDDFVEEKGDDETEDVVLVSTLQTKFIWTMWLKRNHPEYF